MGETRRRLSFFVMVLAYSRKLYVEFTLSQSMEHFLEAHVHAFDALGVPRKIMVDNLRTAVLAHVRGEPPQFNPRRYDVARVLAVRADRQFRVTFEAHRYFVPARFAGATLTLKVYPEHLCLYHDQDLIARHVRCWERHRDIADPDHAKALVAQRRHAQDAHALQRFLALSPQAPKYHEGLALAARPCAFACAQDPRLGRYPRNRDGRPGNGRCPRLRGATAASKSPT